MPSGCFVVCSSVFNVCSCEHEDRISKSAKLIALPSPVLVKVPVFVFGTNTTVENAGTNNEVSLSGMGDSTHITGTGTPRP